MSCKDCFNNCDPSPISDQCVKYTGDAVASLDIEFGQSIQCVQKSLIDYVLTLSNGSGITLSELSADCSFLSDLIAEDYTLSHLLQAFSDAICSLKTSVTSLTPAASSFDVSCLTGVTSSSTQVQILQAVITKLCSLNTRLTTVEGNYVTSSSVNTLIASYLSSTASTAQEYTKMAKYVAYPYHGSLSVFDSNGKGISAQGYDKVYICNGQTVGSFKTPDYRGYSPIGANTGIPGSALDSTVDPSLSANAGYSITPGAKKGSYTHTLSITEEAAHSHTVTDNGHSHSVASGNSNSTKGPGANDSVAWSSAHANGNQDYDLCKGTIAANVGKSSLSTTGISLASAGGGQPHNNTHPVLGCVFIMYIP